MLAKCRAHLSEAGESYWQHFRFAAGVGLMLLAAAVACIIHALVPGCCTRTASRTVDELGRLFRERHALTTVLGETSGVLTLVGLAALTLPAWATLLIAPANPLSSAIAALSIAVPATYLWTNPQLEPVD
jgi:hypothetical protein